MKTTIREFAQKNDLALPRLRRLLNKYSDNVKITHTSKGVNYYAVRRLVKMIEELGHMRIILKSYGENAIIALKR